jgi:hypothetical protein
VFSGKYIYSIAKMNLAIRGISSNLGNKLADTLTRKLTQLQSLLLSRLAVGEEENIIN